MRRSTFPAGAVLALAIIGSFAAPPARPAGPSPRDKLLRLVPPDAAVCLVVRGLREQAQTVAASPFADWASQKVGPKITGSAEFGALKQLESFIEQQIGVSLTELRDDILGDAIVLAYHPGPSGRPNAESGVVMLLARKPEKLKALIDRVNDKQTERNEIKELRPVPYRGVPYTQRVKPDGTAEYYLIRDGLFAFSGQESAMRGVIDQSLAAPAGPGPVARSLDRLGAADAFLTCWINPRALDPELRAQSDAATTPARRAFLRQFAKVWEAVDALAF